MIGLSVSLCVGEMARGEIDPATVEKIIGGTRAPTKENLETLVREYRFSYWQGVEEKAESLFWQFWAEGKIYQPRINDGWIPDISDGIWIQREEEVKRIPYNY